MTTISAGSAVVVSSGTEAGDIVLGGGTLTIVAGGTASGTTLSGGDETV